MKAIVYEKYGSPEVLEIRDVEKPIPGDEEVLIKVHAVSINPYEWHHMRGKPYFARLSVGFFNPKHKILGMDVSGQVESTGKDVKQFKQGDTVFGYSKYGGLAEFTCIREDKTVKIPENSNFKETASIPIAGVTALQGLRDYGKIQSGQKVLINGASGGVGTFAVQIARALGAEVTGVCSTGNLDMVRSIGADKIIDYTQEDFTKSGIQYDLIYDTVGNYWLKDIRKAIKPGGLGVVAGFTTISKLMTVAFLGKSGKIKVLLQSAKVQLSDLQFIAELIENGQLKPVIDREYPLVEIIEAMEYLETGHAKGKVIITPSD